MAGNVEIIIPVGFQNLKILETLTILLKNKILVSEIVKKSLFICNWNLITILSWQDFRKTSNNYGVRINPDRFWKPVRFKKIETKSRNMETKKALAIRFKEKFWVLRS